MTLKPPVIRNRGCADAASGVSRFWLTSRDRDRFGAAAGRVLPPGPACGTGRTSPARLGVVVSITRCAPEPNSGILDSGPARPDQPHPSGLDQLLQARRVQGDLRLPWRLHLAPGAHLAPPQAQAGELEVAAEPLPPRVTADRRQGGTTQPGSGNGQPLPLPGTADPHAMVGNSNRTTMNPSARAWGEPDARPTGTSGSE